MHLLDEKGRPLKSQADVTARWADGSAKWVLFTISGFSLDGGTTVRLRLARGNPPRPRNGITLWKTPAGISINTGLIRFTIASRDVLVPRLERKSAGQWKLRAAGLDLAVTVERNRRDTHYLASAGGRSIHVEADGPLRALVAVRGRHRCAATGGTFGDYVLRFEILAGSPQVRLMHSVVYDGDPERDFVRAIEMSLNARTGGREIFGFGGDDGHEIRFQRQRFAWAPDFRHAELYQDSVTHWRVRRWVDRSRREVFCEEGLRSDGWMELAGRGGRVAVAVRELWQNHPKSLSADAATGRLRVGLYPSRADRLDLQRYSDLIYPMTYEAPCSWKNETIPFDKKSGAHGIRKTHDVLLMLDEPNPSGATLAFNHPLRLEWTPAYTARTRVVVPATARLDPVWLKRTGEYLDFLQKAMVRDGGAGFLDYFDLPMGYSLVDNRWTHDYGGKGYINNEALPCLGLWQAYLLTGRPDAFAMARAMTRHNADIDSYHAGPLAGYGSRHNVNHWGDACKEPRISQPVDKRFLYYLTGDRSVLDLVEVMLGFWERILPGPGQLPTTAHIPALISTLLVATETGLAKMDDWLLRIADALAASVNEIGQIAILLEVDAKNQTARAVPDSTPADFSMFSCFGASQTYAELAERYDHQPLRKALVRLARYQMRPRKERQRLEKGGKTRADCLNTFRALDLLGYAFMVTKDRVFAEHVRKHTRVCRVVIRDLPEPRYGLSGAGRRTAPVENPWPDDPHYLQRVRKYYPCPGTETAQFFEMAVYLHKMQGLMLLLQ